MHFEIYSSKFVVIPDRKKLHHFDVGRSGFCRRTCKSCSSTCTVHVAVAINSLRIGMLEHLIVDDVLGHTGGLQIQSNTKAENTLFTARPSLVACELRLFIAKYCTDLVGGIIQHPLDQRAAESALQSKYARTSWNMNSLIQILHSGKRLTRIWTSREKQKSKPSRRRPMTR